MEFSSEKLESGIQAMLFIYFLFVQRRQSFESGYFEGKHRFHEFAYLKLKNVLREIWSTLVFLELGKGRDADFERNYGGGDVLERNARIVVRCWNSSV